MNKKLSIQVLVALLLPFTLILGGGIWGGTAQHTHRSADQGGVISWIPTGFVGCYAGSTPPTNTLEAYGQAVSRITYAGLFSHLGTTHGAGDGVTTFNLPDLRGRVMIGMDNMGGTPANRVTAAADSLGGAGGSETMTIAQMPAHKHTLTGAVSGFSGGPLSISAGTETLSITDTPNVVSELNPVMGNTGGGNPFNPPFIALKCVIGT